MMLSKSSTSSAAVAMWTTRSHLARPGTMDTVRSHVDTPCVVLVCFVDAIIV